jgi:hypothetical protein
MYDKVKIWIDRAIVGEQFSSIANYLDVANTQINHQTGEIKTYGSLNGLKVSIFVSGLSVVGSLPKYLYGSNVYPLDRHTAADAIEKMSDALHIQVGKAKVTELEFGTNFLMMHQVDKYLVKLGDMPRLNRYHFDPQTLYYKGNGKQQPKVFVFYDKIADAAAKGMVYPDNLKGANLLKYEMRLKGRISQQLRVPEVIASTLLNKSFYRLLINRYQNSYFSISKLNQIKNDVMSEIKTVSDAYNVFVARLISQTDQSQIGGFLEELKDACVFDDRKNYSRLKKKIHEVATKANITVSDELIKELDNEIKNCGAYL